MRHLKTFQLFESWTPKFTRETVWYSIEWSDNYKDLSPGYSDPSDLNQYEEEYYFDSKENAEQHADLIIDMFDSLPDPIPVYRAISAKDRKDIDLEWPGESWSFDKNSATEFGSHNGSNFLLSAKVKKEDVNWVGSIKAYTLFSGTSTVDDENEIVVDDQEKLMDIEITDI